MLIGLGHIQYTFVSEGMFNRCGEATPEGVFILRAHL